MSKGIKLVSELRALASCHRGTYIADVARDAANEIDRLMGQVCDHEFEAVAGEGYGAPSGARCRKCGSTGFAVTCAATNIDL